MCRVLVLWKPTLEISWFRCCGVVVSMLAMVRVLLGWVSLSCGEGAGGTSSVCSRCMAAAVTVSLVWLDSISAVSVW